MLKLPCKQTLRLSLSAVQGCHMLNGETKIREMDRKEWKREQQRSKVIAKTLLSPVSLWPFFRKPHPPNRIIIVGAHRRTYTGVSKPVLCFFMLIEIECLSLNEKMAFK